MAKDVAVDKVTVAPAAPLVGEAALSVGAFSTVKSASS
jgi:hypothetical protein